jgi:uncharacterized protein YbcV (DUF1398 family)
MEQRPSVGGFPHLAQILKEAGVLRNEWHLPSCQSLYVTLFGPVVMQGTPLVSGAIDVPPFNEAALISVLLKRISNKMGDHFTDECITPNEMHP